MQPIPFNFKDFFQLAQLARNYDPKLLLFSVDTTIKIQNMREKQIYDLSDNQFIVVLEVLKNIFKINIKHWQIGQAVGLSVYYYDEKNRRNKLKNIVCSRMKSNKMSDEYIRLVAMIDGCTDAILFASQALAPPAKKDARTLH